MAVSVRNVTQKFGGVYTSLKSVSCSRNYFTYTNEPSQPIQGKSPKWVTPEEAFQDMKSGKYFILHYQNFKYYNEIFLRQFFFQYFLSKLNFEQQHTIFYYWFN